MSSKELRGIIGALWKAGYVPVQLQFDVTIHAIR